MIIQRIVHMIILLHQIHLEIVSNQVQIWKIRFDPDCPDSILTNQGAQLAN